jgi:cysteine-rich repeat protein
MTSTRYAFIFIVAAGALGAGACSSKEPPVLGSGDQELTVAQCSYFADGDKVQICHRTGSARNPYTIIRTNVASCGGHGDHLGDYVTSTDPRDAEYDPTCNGQGCFPEGAPFDGSVECCAGLSPQNGVCTDIDECATNNGNCGAGFSCADDAVVGAAPVCTNIDDCAGDPCENGGTCHDGIDGYTCECAAGFSGASCATNIDDCAGNPCANGGTCADGIDSYTCACTGGYTGTNCDTPPAPRCGDGVVDAGEQCDDGNPSNGDGCSATCTLESTNPCPAGGEKFEDTCYVHVISTGTQPAAEAACVANYGGHLASINSAEENQFVSHVMDPDGLGGWAHEYLTGWIGGYADSGFCGGAAGTYSWTDGSAWTFNAWRTNTGEPSDVCPQPRTCIQLWPDNAANRSAPCPGGCQGWNDGPCSTAVIESYVCQYAAAH